MMPAYGASLVALLGLLSVAHGAESTRVNLATASEHELEKLPGIGPTSAYRIVQLRSRGLLKRVDDLVRVKGLGLKRVKQLREHVYVELAPRPQ